MLTHSSLKHVPLLAVELRDSLRVDLEAIVAPRIENSVCDRLRQGWRLEACNSGLNSGLGVTRRP